MATMNIEAERQRQLYCLNTQRWSGRRCCSIICTIFVPSNCITIGAKSFAQEHVAGRQYYSKYRNHDLQLLRVKGSQENYFATVTSYYSVGKEELVIRNPTIIVF